MFHCIVSITPFSVFIKLSLKIYFLCVVLHGTAKNIIEYNKTLNIIKNTSSEINRSYWFTYHILWKQLYYNINADISHSFYIWHN